MAGDTTTLISWLLLSGSAFTSGSGQSLEKLLLFPAGNSFFIVALAT